MKRNGDKKNAGFAKIIEILFGVLVEAVITYLGIKEKELPLAYFCRGASILMMLLFWVVVIWGYKCWDIFRNFCKKLNNTYVSAGKDLKKKSAFFFDCIENIKNLLNEWFRVSLCTFKLKQFWFFIITLVLLCIFNPQDAGAYFQRIQDVMGVNLENQEIENKEAAEKEMEEDEKTEKDIERNGDMEKDLEIGICENDYKGWRFVLDYPNAKKELDERRRDQVFFLDKTKDVYKEIDKMEVLGLVYKWQLYPVVGVEYLNVKDALGNTYYFYNEKEDAFKREVSIASQYKNSEEWLKYAPHSSEIDFYIEGREGLNCMEVASRKGCYQIWWLLANDYQYYAQEYEAQTQNNDAILYYYTNSIYCCMKALEFSISQEEYNRTYHYMVMRYHDMFREDCLIPSVYKDRAVKIYLILQQQDILS